MSAQAHGGLGHLIFERVFGVPQSSWILESSPFGWSLPHQKVPDALLQRSKTPDTHDPTPKSLAPPKKREKPGQGPDFFSFRRGGIWPPTFGL